MAEDVLIGYDKTSSVLDFIVDNVINKIWKP